MEGFDLVGLDVRDRRAKQVFTVLTAKAPWTRDVIARLVAYFHTEVYSLPGSISIIIFGEHPERNVDAAVGSVIDFDHKVVVGYDNPELPFKPPSY